MVGALLDNHLFVLVASGTVLLGAAAAMVGSASVLKGQSLIGDAMGHASFPGIVLTYMLFSSRRPSLLMLGAIVAGMTAYLMIQGARKHPKATLDTGLSLILSSFFGLGMVLKSYIQGNPDYAGASQAGLQNYIFGQAAYMNSADRRVIVIVSLAALALFILFYKEIKLSIFDPEYARAAGFKTSVTNAVILVTTVSLIAVGLKIVGAVLISSMLIVPTVSARQWSHRYPVVLTIAGLVGAVSAFVGSVISSFGRGISTGPSIILAMSVCGLISFLLGPRSALRRRRRLRRQTRDKRHPFSQEEELSVSSKAAIPAKGETHRA